MGLASLDGQEPPTLIQGHRQVCRGDGGVRWPWGSQEPHLPTSLNVYGLSRLACCLEALTGPSGGTEISIGLPPLHSLKSPARVKGELPSSYNRKVINHHLFAIKSQLHLVG